jgi:hypothetical protein
MFLNPDHVTIAVADAGPAIEFFALLGFRKEHVATIDGGLPARYMGMPGMKALHITLALEGADPRFEIQLLEFDPTPGTDPGALKFKIGDLRRVAGRGRRKSRCSSPANWCFLWTMQSERSANPNR